MKSAETEKKNITGKLSQDRGHATQAQEQERALQALLADAVMLLSLIHI